MPRGLKQPEQLAGTSTNAERRAKFEKIAWDQTTQIQRTLKSAGLVYVRVERWGEQSSQVQFEDEGLGQAASKEEVLNYLRAQVYPPSLIEEHIRKDFHSLFGQRVDQVDRGYRNTLGFPVPLAVSVVMDALRALVTDRNRILGLQHPKGNFCGERVNLSDSDLGQAVLTQPWPAPSDRSASAIPFVAPAVAIDSDRVELPTDGSKSLSKPELAIPATVVEERGTPHCLSLGELRQQAAARLIDIEEPIISVARFTVFADYRGQELSGIPAAFRGALSGQGDLDLQLDITVRGPMSKMELEQYCERLPTLPGANFSVRFSVQVSSDERRSTEESQT